MDSDEPRRRMTMDQKRMIVLVSIIAVVIGIASIGVAWLALTIGLPLWIAVILALVLAAGIGLFTFINLI